MRIPHSTKGAMEAGIHDNAFMEPLVEHGLAETKA